MKNRLIALLLAFAMCFSLCSCGVDFDDDIDDEKDSEISELDKYVEAVYVYLIIEMCARFDEGYEIFRIDYNHDDVDDWIVHCLCEPQDFWLLFDGGCLDASPKLFFNWGAAGKLDMYISKSGNIYVENSYLVTEHGYTSYFCYNGEAQDYCLNYEYGDTNDVYEVNGKASDKDAYDDYLSDLHLSPLTGGETSFDGYLDISEDSLDLVLERVCEFPFVDSCTKKDVDDDSKDDLVFSTKLSDDSGPNGISGIYYECGNESREGFAIDCGWRSNYHVICSNSSHTTVDTVTEDEAQSLLSGEKKDDDKAEMGKDKEYALSDLCGVWTTNGATQRSDFVDTPNDIKYYFKNFQGVSLFQFDENGSIYNKYYGDGNYEQLASWQNCGNNMIKLSVDGGSVTATVSFGYDKPLGLDTMTLASSTGTVKFYKGQIEMTESDLVGTWENYHTSHGADACNGGEILVLYADHTYERTVYGHSGSIENVSSGTWEWDIKIILDNEYGTFELLMVEGSYLHTIAGASYYYYYYKTE